MELSFLNADQGLAKAKARKSLTQRRRERREIAEKRKTGRKKRGAPKHSSLNEIQRCSFA
jgi:hypothetical protein